MFGSSNKEVEASANKTKEFTEFLLSENSVVNGNIGTSKATIYGTVEGSLSSETTFLLGANGVVRGPVFSQSAIVHGSVNGNLTCKGPVRLTATAKVTGDIQCTSLVLEQGAYFCGKVICTEAAQ